MSAPAHKVRARKVRQPERARAAPARRPRRVPQRKTTTARRPAPKQITLQKSKPKSASRGLFVFVTGAVLVSMVFGLAALNAVLAQGAFKVGSLSNQEQSLRLQNETLRLQVDELSSPRRITSEAKKLGLVLPDPTIQVVQGRDSRGSRGGGG